MSKQTTAGSLMSPSTVFGRAEMTVAEAIQAMLEACTSCLPVVDDEGVLLGIITEYDVMNLALSGEADRTKVGEVMTRDVIAFSPDDDFETVVNVCVTRRIHRAPVVQDGKLVGGIARRDILREMLRVYGQR